MTTADQPQNAPENAPKPSGDGARDPGSAAAGAGIFAGLLRQRTPRAIITSLLIAALIAGGAVAYLSREGVELYPWQWLVASKDPAAVSFEGPKTLIWRDGAGALRTATVDGPKYHAFVLLTDAAFNQARTEIADTAKAKLQADTAEIFGQIEERIPRYASWHFQYTTKYVLMAQALYGLLTRADGIPLSSDKAIDSIRIHLADYLQQQYSTRVLQPGETSAKLQAAFERNVGELHTQWLKLIAAEDQRFVEFVAAQGGGKPLGEVTLGERKLDWDLRPDAALPAERTAFRTFRSGLLTIKVTRPAKLTPAGMVVEDDKDAKEDVDDIAHVVVGLFQSVIDPLAQEGGAALSSVIAGAVGAMAGGTAATAAGAQTAGIAISVPLGALVGLAMTVSTDIATNRLEEHLTRGSFEQSVRDGLTKTNQAVDKTLMTLLDEHANAQFLEASRLVTPPKADGG
jgi:hypothetical protein